MIGTKIDLQKIKPLPLAKRNSLSTVEEVLVPLDAEIGRASCRGRV